LQRVHETVLKDVLGDDGGALGLGSQNHVLRLHVRGEAGIFFGGNVGGIQQVAVGDAQGVGGRGDAYTALLQFLDQCAEMRGIAVGQRQIAAGQHRRNHKRARFDAVRNDAMPGAVQLVNALNPYGVRACALDFGAHLGQERRQIHDLRLARAVFHDGFTLGEGGGHHQVFCSSNGDLVKSNVPAVQALRAGLDIAVLLSDGSPELLETFDMQVNGTGADGAASRLGDPGATQARDQRSQDERGGAHGLHQVISSFRIDEIVAGNGGAVRGASVAEFDLGAHGDQQVALGLDVADVGNVFQDDRLV